MRYESDLRVPRPAALLAVGALLLSFAVITARPAMGEGDDAGETDSTHPADADAGHIPADEAGTPAPGAEALLPVFNEVGYRAALLTASGNAEPDTISIQNDFTISDPGIAGDPTHTGADALTIEGNGFTVDAAAAVRFLFHDSSADLTIQNLTVDGFSSSDSGGAVESHGDTTITASTFTGNIAGDDGGAIDTSGDVLVTGSTFTDNTAADGDGGAIDTSDGGDDVATEGSTFTDNTASNYGGAISTEDSIEVTGSTFTGNEAEFEDGGALDAVIGSVSATDSTFTDNTADGPGGAIATEDDDDAGTGTVTVLRSTFTGNESTNSDGGAIDADDALTATDSTFTDNTAEGDGGALDTSDDSELAPITLDGVTLSGNESTDDGGGAVSVEGDLTAVNTTITGNTAASEGGGITADDGDVTLVHVTLAGNSSDEGAQVYNDINDLVTFGTTFSDPQGGGDNCDIAGAVTSNGHNQSTDDSCDLTGPGDVENADDPQLGALGDNGGPTPTMLPAAGSPLLDAIPVAECDPAVCVVQRDVIGPQVDGCDVGAVEVEVVEPVPPAEGPIAASPPFTG